MAGPSACEQIKELVHDRAHSGQGTTPAVLVADAGASQIQATLSAAGSGGGPWPMQDPRLGWTGGPNTRRPRPSRTDSHSQCAVGVPSIWPDHAPGSHRESRANGKDDPP
eukprot:7568197-Pyramimonas_sp.AAC.1